MRKAIWIWIRKISKVPEGALVPWWMGAIKAFLYPLEFFYWRMGNAVGYQWDTDTWLIDRVRFSALALYKLGHAPEGIYRVTRQGDLITWDEIEDPAKEGDNGK